MNLLLKVLMVILKLLTFICAEKRNLERSKSIDSIDSIYENCNKSEITCLGIESSLNLSKIDCINQKNCLAFSLIHHLTDLKEFNIYLITSQRNAELIKLNIYHGNYSNQLSIELNCSDFQNHKPKVLMNARNKLLSFNQIPEINTPRELLSLSNDYLYCVWSTEENFFINGIFRNEASYLYFDLKKRVYDVRIIFKIKNELQNANYNERKVSSFDFVKKSKSNFYSFTNLLLSLNTIILITLLISILFHHSIFKHH